ncbi:DNA primase family protein [Eremococcus coleocola]|uniref:DNA primase family protein n=1 Tax=Eremococcus coleocola TaxID=88132 RepID=UPI0004289719|nr:DUF5906 domain-containing protein [Eremococcus coleocola]
MYIEYVEGAKHSVRGAEISDSLDSFSDAGYILEDNDLVVDIDCLSHDQIEKLILIFNIKTHLVWTDRGVHLYFKKPDGFRGSKGVTPLGFEVEYKHKSNTKSITVKRNGKARKVENAGIREDLPDFLKKGKYDILIGLGDGDGRNNKMFAHRRKVHNKPHWQTILRFINDVIFDTPLPPEELDLLMRETNIEAVKDGESLIADLVMQEKRVIKYAGKIYMFNGGEYTSDKDEIARIVYRYCEGQKTRYVQEVLSQIDMRCEVLSDDAVFNIKLNNGVLKKGRFIEVDYKDFTPFVIDLDYKPEATPVKDVDDYLKHLTGGDKEYEKRLLEILGHILITDPEMVRLLATFSIFVGDGGNGKGTLLTIIRSIIGTENCSALSVKNLEDERYLQSIQGKLVNLGDDIQDEPINNTQMKYLKNISSGDVIEMRKLYEQSKPIQLITSLIFTSNHKIKTYEKGDSYKRRVNWLPMYSKPVKKDPQFINKLTTQEAREYWLKLIIEGYFRLYEQGGFSPCKAIEDFNEEYHHENNTAIEYLGFQNPEDIHGMRTPEIYDEYEVWTNENGLNCQSRKQFQDTVKEVFGLEPKPRKINSKTQRVYSIVPNVTTEEVFERLKGKGVLTDTEVETFIPRKSKDTKS